MPTDLKTARRTNAPRMELGVLDFQVALYKATASPGRDAKWETRLVDAEGKPIAAEAAAPASDALPGLSVMGDPLGGGEDERQLEHDDFGLDGEGNDTLNPEPTPVPEVTRQRGFETARGFVPAEKELEAITEATKLETVRVGGFVRAEQVDRARVIGAYYIAPEGDSAERAVSLRALDMLRSALQETSRFAVVKFTKKTVQALGVIAPHRSGALVILELAWGADARKPPRAAILTGYSSSRQEVEACVELIEAMAEPRASLDELQDDAVVLRREARALAEEKRLAEFAVPERPRMDATVHDLDEAMAESVEVADALIATG